MAEIVQGFPPLGKTLSPEAYDKQIQQFCAKLDKLPASTWPKVNLRLLDPAVNSLPYLVTLVESAKQVGKDKQLMREVLDQIIVFFRAFDARQMRYVGEHWRNLWYSAADFLQKLDIMDFSPLSDALLCLDPAASTFTTTHLYFLRLCLLNGVPSQALPILDMNIYAFPHSIPKNNLHEFRCEETELSSSWLTLDSGFTDKITPDAVLHYYLAGAHVYIGARNYHRARLYLEHVILYPSANHNASALQVEAYKKWLLVGLLATGKAWPQPRTADQGTMKAVKALSKAYEALVDNFEKRQWRKFHAEADVGQQMWSDDGNRRLVVEVGQALMQYRVVDLQKTYAALPVSRVAKHLSLTPEETLSTLDHMIRSSSLNASLSPGASAGEAVLRFNPEQSTSTATESDLEAQTKRIEQLVAAMREADRQLELTKEHVQNAARNKLRAGPDADIAEQMDLSWDTSGAPVSAMLNDDNDDGEEDIMA